MQWKQPPDRRHERRGGVKRREREGRGRRGGGEEHAYASSLALRGFLIELACIFKTRHRIGDAHTQATHTQDGYVYTHTIDSLQPFVVLQGKVCDDVCVRANPLKGSHTEQGRASIACGIDAWPSRRGAELHLSEPSQWLAAIRHTQRNGGG